MSQTAVKTAAQTYADLCAIADEKRYEVIDGVIYAMSPAPRINHQQILFYLSNVFGAYFKGKTCTPFIAPTDVFLTRDKDGDIKDCKNVVQPDLFVVCDGTKIIDEGCKGAPDFIVEILSPSSRRNDFVRKLALYAEFGVGEYWIIDPDKKMTLIYELVDGMYNSPDTYFFNEPAESRLFPGLTADLSEVRLL